MAKLTPAAKGLITLAILAVAAAAAWQLGVKDLVKGDGPVAGDGDGDGNNNGNGNDATATGDAIGTKDNPLKVSIVSFHGYAPALVANGNSLTTQPGSIYDKLGVNVEFIIQDDIPTLTTIFESGTAQCAWRTSDFWAQEQPNLRNGNLDAKAVMIVDNTQGADAVITNDPNINKIEDLAGKKVALLQYTPSDGMLIDAVENSALSARKKQSIKYVYINVDEGLSGVRAAFKAKQVDAAVLWDPDLSLALKGTPGSKVIYSTKTATNLIYDVIVCDTRALNNAANKGAFQAFVKGWMDGVPVARKSPDQALDALVKNEEFFALLVKEQGKDFVKGLFDSLVWTGLEDNIRILGLSGGTNHYARVYKRFDDIYRAAGALANPNSPRINPQDSIDLSFIKSMMAEAPQASEEAKKPQFTFDAESAKKAATKDAALTKVVAVNFATGSAELTKRSMKTIDDDMVPIIENNGSAYFEISGNTDSTGSKKTNKKLSKERAEAVAKYLIEQWEFPRDRFVVVGNGPAKPLCNEKKPDEEGLKLDECRARNRTTRLAVLSR